MHTLNSNNLSMHTINHCSCSRATCDCATLAPPSFAAGSTDAAYGAVLHDPRNYKSTNSPLAFSLVFWVVPGQIQQPHPLLHWNLSNQLSASRVRLFVSMKSMPVAWQWLVPLATWRHPLVI